MPVAGHYKGALNPVSQVEDAAMAGCFLHLPDRSYIHAALRITPTAESRRALGAGAMNESEPNMEHRGSSGRHHGGTTPYRMVAIDLDGTLLRSDGTMGERTRRALQAAVRQGIRVVICTGRRFRTTLPILSELQLAVPVVVHGGLLIKRCRHLRDIALQLSPPRAHPGRR